MRHLIAAFALVLVAASSGTAQVEPAVDGVASTPSRLTGRILYDGPPPPPKPLRVPPTISDFRDGEQLETAELAARGQLRDLNLLDESLVIGEQGGVANVVIWLSTKDVPAPPWNSSLPESTIRATEGRFDPHILAFWNAAPLKWVNNTHHGINFSCRGVVNVHNRVLAPGQVIDIEVERPERLPTLLTSSVHPWFAAYLLPLEHPYFVVTGPDGRFEMDALPRGEWEFAIWHELCSWLPTDRFPKGRFRWNVRPGENSLGDMLIQPDTFARAGQPSSGPRGANARREPHE